MVRVSAKINRGSKAHKRWMRKMDEAMSDDGRYPKTAEYDPDNPPLTAEDFENAVIIPPMKESISLRVDSDTLSWFREQGRGYQTVINNVLRQFVALQRKKTT